MQIESRDYSYEISSLEKLITTIQSNVYFTITIIVALLALAVGLAGWALAILVKSRVDKKVEEELGIIEEKVKILLKENPQILWARGHGILNKQSIIDERGTYEYEYIMVGIQKFKKENLVYFDAHYFLEGKKISIDERNVIITDDGIKVSVKATGGFHVNIHVYIFVMWSNSKY